ncbi:MAG TPA: hypothetical protein ENN67_02185 [Firmicutes bacterium]|nr:hypothetical protein [Bacillota bacterium]
MQETKTMIHELLSSRRSIRKFKPDPIDRDILERIMASACWAPSAMNNQPWKFFVLTDEMRDRLALLHHDIFTQMKETFEQKYDAEGVEKRRRLYENLGDAPVAVVCYSDLIEGEPDKVSTAMACENLVIAAWAEGIGSVVMRSSLLMKDEISFLCGVDTKIMELVLVILLGYPDENPQPQERRKNRVLFLSNPRDIK